ncbi:uncharacterized protein EV420DRAFT_751564 [Desarmillaria tabescens]|uniref:Uncharacterized protein n=1 Tax=Armillaria tabescens TaxID=1929756 RepID=A0AA39K1C2_ARMTA|nr:uncharacterized protein EV420DRAFT_751564 [Desarmillaria tabescens]KAK0450373.1 hypothetical protein EV420DRAFT_751564 [Desarmillaria tabescens]
MRYISMVIHILSLHRGFKKYVSDRDGVELHRLNFEGAHRIYLNGISSLPLFAGYRTKRVPTSLTPASALQDNSGYLKYQDTSTGQLLRTPEEAWFPYSHDTVFTQRRHPSSSPEQPPWNSAPCTSRSRGQHEHPSQDVKDQTVKVWDCWNWKGAVGKRTARGGDAEVEWSTKGALI